MSRLHQVFALVLPLAATPALAEPRHLPLSEALDLALTQNLELRASDLQERASDDDSRSVRGNLLPKLKVEANLFEWDSAFTAAFAIPGAPVSAPLAIRDQQTTTVTLTATQPITGLYTISQRWQVQRELAEAARAEGRTVRAELAYRVTEAYLRLLQAIDLRAIAAETVSDIAEQVRQAHVLVQGGTLIPADELRTRVALSQAQQDLLRADAALGVARGLLAITVGLPVDAEIEPERLDRTALPALPASPAGALAGAAHDRPEVAAARARSSAAHAAKRAARSELFPAISVQGAYQRNDGFGFIQPKNAEYFAAFLSWNFWEWGTQFYAAEAAKVRAEGSEVELARRQRDISLDVMRRYLEAKAAFAAISVAHDAVAQASEAARVTKALYSNGSATTTDVLDSELSLERARANDARSTYDALVAYAALTRASGSAAPLEPHTAAAP